VLERAQEVYAVSKFQHRVILVFDLDGHVVGKISQLRVLKALENEREFDNEIEEMRKFKFSEAFIAHIRDQFSAQKKVIKEDILREVAAKKVEEFMQTLTPGEYVSEDSAIDTAINKLVAGAHTSLLVTRDNEIVGIIRLADVFAALFHEIVSLEEGHPGFSSSPLGFKIPDVS
jgi:CBS domain containing-hemolysin-like protein